MTPGTPSSDFADRCERDSELARQRRDHASTQASGGATWRFLQWALTGTAAAQAIVTAVLTVTPPVGQPVITVTPPLLVGAASGDLPAIPGYAVLVAPTPGPRSGESDSTLTMPLSGTASVVLDPPAPVGSARGG